MATKAEEMLRRLEGNEAVEGVITLKVGRSVVPVLEKLREQKEVRGKNGQKRMRRENLGETATRILTELPDILRAANGTGPEIMDNSKK